MTIIGLNGPMVSTFINKIKIMVFKGSRTIEQVKAVLAFALLIVDIGQSRFYQDLKIERD